MTPLELPLMMAQDSGLFLPSKSHFLSYCPPMSPGMPESTMARLLARLLFDLI